MLLPFNLKERPWEVNVLSQLIHSPASHPEEGPDFSASLLQSGASAAGAPPRGSRSQPAARRHAHSCIFQWYVSHTPGTMWRNCTPASTTPASSACSGHPKPKPNAHSINSLSHPSCTQRWPLKASRSSVSGHSQMLLVTLSFPRHSLFKDLLTRSAIPPAEIHLSHFVRWLPSLPTRC